MKVAIRSDEKTSITEFVVEELKRRGHEVELFCPLKDEPPSWVEVEEAAKIRLHHIHE